MAFVELKEQSRRGFAKTVMLNVAHVVKVDPESGEDKLTIVALINGQQVKIIGDYQSVATAIRSGQP